MRLRIGQWPGHTEPRPMGRSPSDKHQGALIKSHSHSSLAMWQWTNAWSSQGLSILLYETGQAWPPWQSHPGDEIRCCLPSVTIELGLWLPYVQASELSRSLFTIQTPSRFKPRSIDLDFCFVLFCFFDLDFSGLGLGACIFKQAHWVTGVWKPFDKMLFKGP